MSSRPHARAIALTTVLLGLALPSAAVASSSGSGGTSGGSGGTSGGSGLTTTTATSPTAPGQPGGTSAPGATSTPTGGPVSAQGNGFTLTSNSVGTRRQTLSFSGAVSSAGHGDMVSVQRQTGAGSWQTIARATVAGNGSFTTAWRPSASGVINFRATLGGPAGTASAASAAPASASPTLAVTIYADAIATIYGPGFYGHKTACGVTLTAATIGVASRRLKCGTKVAIDYDGQTITVPVIDRGPYANNATWDLTEATAQALGVPATETVGAAVL